MIALMLSLILTPLAYRLAVRHVKWRSRQALKDISELWLLRLTVNGAMTLYKLLARNGKRMEARLLGCWPIMWITK